MRVDLGDGMGVVPRAGKGAREQDDEQANDLSD